MAWDTPPDRSRIKLEIYSRLFWMILKGYIFSNFMQRLVLIKREPGVVFTWLLVFGLYCQHLFHNFLRTWVTFALLLILTIPWFYGILLALFVLVQFLKKTNKQTKKKPYSSFQSQGKSVPNGNSVSPSHHTPPQANAVQPSKPARKPLSSQGPVKLEGANNLVRLRLLILNTFKFKREKWAEFITLYFL